MKKMKRLAALGTAVVLAAGMMAGCGGSSGSSTATTAAGGGEAAGQRAAQKAEWKRLIWFSAILMQKPIPGTKWH